MKKRKGVTKVDPVRDPKRVGVEGRQVRINWEGKISFGTGLVKEIGMYPMIDHKGWSVTLHENKEENILYLDFDPEWKPYNSNMKYSSIRREEKLGGGFVTNCKDLLRGLSIQKIHHLVRQTKENKTITSICDYDPSVSLDGEIVVEVKIT